MKKVTTGTQEQAEERLTAETAFKGAMASASQ